MRSRLVVTNVECHQKLRKAFKRHKSRRYWVAKYQAYKQSGLGPGKFCQSHGLAKSSFYRWFGRLEAEGVLEGNFIPVEVEDSPVTFVEEDFSEPILPDSPCEAEMPGAPSELKLTLGRGIVLSIPKGFDPITLRQIVEVLSPC